MKRFSGNVRAPFLDYMSPGIYMITLNKLPWAPAFSSIIENDGRFGTTGPAIALHTKLGQAIRYSFQDFHDRYPSIDFWHHIIMENHIHFILYINTKLDEKLGRYIARFKSFIKEKAEYKGIIPRQAPSLFEEGFNDQYIGLTRNLQAVYDYLDDNPNRYWEIKNHPENFVKINNLEIKGEHYRAYGNLNLLKNPFITPVIYHRRYSEVEYLEKKSLWQYVRANGGVLISPFIHPREKDLLKEVILRSGKVILFDYIPDNSKWKPYKQLFEMCKRGELLILSPHGHEKLLPLRKGEHVSRQESLFLNGHAEKIAGEGFPV